MKGDIREPSAAPNEGAELLAKTSAVGRAWAHALYQMMEDGPLASDGPVIAWGQIGGGETIAKVRDHAAQTERDVIYLGFASAVSDGPTNLVVAAVGRRGVTVHENCEVWAFSRRYDQVEILSAARRFKLDKAGRLTSKPNGLDEMRARRVARAQARWRSLANDILEESQSENSSPTGGPAA